MDDWRPIAGFDGMYEVSRDGQVRTWKTQGSNAPRQAKAEAPRIMRQALNHNGYLSVGLRRAGKSSTRRIHRLVLEAFVGPAPAGMGDACHSDGDQLNNRLENLRWDSRKGNLRDCIEHGTILRGEKANMAKLTSPQVLEICDLLNSGQTTRSIAAQFNVTQSVIWCISSGRTWGWLTGRAP